jgi:hypothetical protein
MATWKKVIVSGSNAELNSLNVTTNVNVTGSLTTSGSVSLKSLTPLSASYIVGYDPTTGNLYYEGTGSLVPTTASYAISASQAVSASYAISSSYAATSSYLKGSEIYVNSIFPTTGNSANRIFTENSNVGFGPIGSTVIYTSTTPLVLNAGSGTSVVQVTGSLNISNGVTGSSFTGSFTGSFKGDGGGLTNLTASNAFALSQSTGITAFNYNGGSTAAIQVSGSSTLTSGSLTLWTGNAFGNSSISENIGTVLINKSGGLTIQQGGLYVTGAATFHDSVVMQGDLTVQGTASFQNSQNLAIADQFILLNSGSTSFQDSGFVISTGNTGNSGSAFFLETSNTAAGTTSQNGRFAVAGNVQPNATTVTAEEYANTTKITNGAPNASIPQFGGTSLGQGNMWVDTGTGDIYIYA